MKQLELEDTGGLRQPPPRWLLRPRSAAPGQEHDPAREIPAHVMPFVRGATRVFPAPGGAHLLFVPRRDAPELFEPRLLPPDGGKPRRLDVGNAQWPFEHAWTPDGSRVYLACMHQLWVVHRDPIQVRLVDECRPGQRFSSVAVSREFYATEDSDRFLVRQVANDQEVIARAGAEGLVVVTRGGRFVLQSSLGKTRLVAIRGTEGRLVGSLDHLAVACWEEDDQVYVNLSLDDSDGEHEVHDDARTYRIVDIDAMYPEDWA